MNPLILLKPHLALYLISLHPWTYRVHVSQLFHVLLYLLLLSLQGQFHLLHANIAHISPRRHTEVNYVPILKCSFLQCLQLSLLTFTLFLHIRPMSWICIHNYHFQLCKVYRCMKLRYWRVVEFEMNFRVGSKQKVVPLLQRYFIDCLPLFHDCQWDLWEKLFIFLQVLTHYPLFSVLHFDYIASDGLKNFTQVVWALVFGNPWRRYLLDDPPVDFVIWWGFVGIVEFSLLSAGEFISNFLVSLELIPDKSFHDLVSILRPVIRVLDWGD